MTILANIDYEKLAAHVSKNMPANGLTQNRLIRLIEMYFQCAYNYKVIGKNALTISGMIKIIGILESAGVIHSGPMMYDVYRGLDSYENTYYLNT